MKRQSDVWDLESSGDCDVAIASNGNAKDRNFAGQSSDRVSLKRSTNSNKVWNHMVDCEARNALQVILSGSEILLDTACRISTSDQKAILERILASAHHLSCMIATLTKPDEQIGEILAECMNAGGLDER
jgi:hypothetical protein